MGKLDHLEQAPAVKYILSTLCGDKGIFVTDGADWKKARKTAAPLFHQSSLINIYEEFMIPGVKTFVDRMDAEIVRASGVAHMPIHP
jgi:cytochrome P450